MLFSPDCLENSQHPLRGNLSVNISKLNPIQDWAPPLKGFLLDSGPAFLVLGPGSAWRPATLKPHSELYVPWITSDITEWLNKDSSKCLTVAIARNGHKTTGFSQAQLWVPGKWKLLRILIQGCNLVWNVPEWKHKSFCVFPEYSFLN